MNGKYYSRLAVNLILTRESINGEKEILLQLRQNTGYMDNMYDFACSGHVEKNESFSMALVREAKEEIGITTDERDLVFLAINHDYQQDHVQVYFATKKYYGEPKVCEEKECGGLLWVNINNLPKNIIPYNAKVLEDINLEIFYDDGDFKRLNDIKNTN